MKYWKVVLATMLLSGSIMIFAQELKTDIPSWVSTAPSKNRSVGQGSTMEEARTMAASMMFEQLDFSPENGSLYAALLASDTVLVDTRKLIASAAAASSFLTNKKEFQNDSAVWVYCEMPNSRLKAFADSMQTAILEEGESALEEGRKQKAAGNLYGAAIAWAEGLNAITPLMYKQLMLPDGMELACTLYKEYVSVFNGVSVTVNPATGRSPMVKGEEIPNDFQLRISSATLPVSNFPVKVWFDRVDSDGLVRYDKKTGKAGESVIHVTKAPMADSATLFVVIDEKAFSELPQTFASGKIVSALKMIAEPQEIRLVAFDPTPLVYFDVPQEDSIFYIETFRQLIDSCKFRQTPDLSQADIIMTAVAKGEPSAPYSAGDYQLVSYASELLVKLYVKESKEEIAAHEVSDFKVTQPAGKDLKRIRAFAITAMMRKLALEMSPKMPAVSYDKRAVVYGRSE